MRMVVIAEVDSKEDFGIELAEEFERKIKSVDTSDYARFFDSECPNWSKDAELNLAFLKHSERYASEVLKNKGYLFLNDVYDILGFSRSQAGQVVGWIYDEKNPVGDNYVDFDIYSERNQGFINGSNDSALLDFNVDGIIIDKI